MSSLRKRKKVDDCQSVFAASSGHTRAEDEVQRLLQAHCERVHRGMAATESLKLLKASVVSDPLRIDALRRIRNQKKEKESFNERTDGDMASTKLFTTQALPVDYLAQITRGKIDEEFSKVIVRLERCEEGVLSAQQLKKMFENGQIPLGFTSSPHWNRCYEECKIIEKEIDDIAKRKAELEGKIEKFNTGSYTEETDGANDFSSTKKELRDVKNREEEFRRVNSSRMLKLTKNLQEVELSLATQLEDQLRTQPTEFAALVDDTSEQCKLSLLFNAVGMSEDIITQLKHITAREFLSESMSFHNLSRAQDFGPVKDLMYLRHMMRYGRVPYQPHKENCTVCSCDTPEELHEMLQSQGLQLFQLPLLLQYKLNGPRCMFLEVADLSLFFGIQNDKIEGIMLSVAQLNALHRLAFRHSATLIASGNIHPTV